MNKAGVYIHRDKQGNVLYVGKTGNLKSRTIGHIGLSHWVSEISDIVFIRCDSHRERGILEVDSIRNLKPKYNKVMKDVPSDQELSHMHFVFTPHRFLDKVRGELGMTEEDLARFLGVSTGYLQLVRLRFLSVADYVFEPLFGPLGCGSYMALRDYSNAVKLACINARSHQIYLKRKATIELKKEKK